MNQTRQVAEHDEARFSGEPQLSGKIGAVAMGTRVRNLD